MKLSDIAKKLRIFILCLLGGACYVQPVSAEVWSTVRDTVISNNAVYDCTECHSYLKTIAGNSSDPLSRHGAPTVPPTDPAAANFDGVNDITAYNNITRLSGFYGAAADPTYGFIDDTNDMLDNAKDRIYEWAADFINTGYMPMDPTADVAPGPPDGIIDDFADATDLSPALKARILNWALQGAPYALPTAVTDNNPTSITKTSATLQGDFNTNVHIGTAVPGSYYFEFGETASYGNLSSVTSRSLTTAILNTNKSIAGLKCGTLYHYRARATNGAATGASAAAGSDRTFTTSACTAPVIAGVTIVANVTDQSTIEDTFKDFALTVTDDDPGSLQWSKTNGPNGSSVSLIGATSTANSGSATLRYTPAANLNGNNSDSFTVTVNNMNTATSRTITFNMSITAVNDPPVVTVNGTVNYQELDPATTLDSNITVTEFDATDLIIGATVVITNYASVDGEVLACNGTLGAGNLTGISSCNFSAGSLTLAGSTSTTNYRNALQTVTYFNPSANPTVGDRTVAFQLQDNSGQGNSQSATSNVTVSVSSVSTPPTITGFPGTTAFTENTPVNIVSSINITDPDSPVGNELNRARLTLSTNFNAAQDSLVCPVSLPAGISCGYFAPTLTLGSASTNSLADFISAVQQVQYINNSDNPTTASRTLTLTARDSSNTESSIVSRFISITPVNDAPGITSTAPSAATLNIIEQQPANIYQLSQSDVDDTAFSYSLGATGLAGNTPAGDMTISASGLVSWTPPRTAVFDNASAMVTVTVTDVDASTAGSNTLSVTQMFNLATSPLDTDSDGVPDYSDNCPAQPNAGQEDLDNDTVHILPQTDPSGIPANGDVDPSARDAANIIPDSYLKGGDACDQDVDGDGISKVFEDSVAYLSDTNAADAGLDQDGDGVSNRDEFLAGTDPAVDSVGPIVIAPADVTVNAKGYYTRVDLGVASASDGNDGAVSIIVPVVDAVLGACSELSKYPLQAPAFRPGAHLVRWTTCDKAGNVSFDTQNVRVKPIINTTAGQIVGEGQVAVLRVWLNGPAAQYPVTVDYQVVAGSAGNSDHNARAGTITINQTDGEGNNPGRVGALNINIVNDGLVEDGEDFSISLSNANNALLGAVKTQLFVIVGSDSVPIIDLAVVQAGTPTGPRVYGDAGNVVSVTAKTIDSRPSTVPSFDWSMTHNALSPIAANITSAANTSTLSIDLSGVPAGNYPVRVSVNDNGRITSASLLLSVIATSPDVADCNVDGTPDSNTDCDADGIDNVTEGVSDSDADGIANYLDDNRIVDASVIQNQSGDAANSYLLSTDSGLVIRLGTTAVTAGATGVLVSQQNIDEHGGQAGSAGLATTDTYANLGGYYDYEITGLNELISTARVVIPLQSAILRGAEYRKYNGSAWATFVENNLNTISSAKGELGVCPAPGSIEYTPGLTAFDFCVQLTLEDGGPNDADAERNFVIRDPGGVALAPAVEAAPVASDGRLGVMHPALLLVLLVPSLLRARGRRRD